MSRPHDWLFAVIDPAGAEVARFEARWQAEPEAARRGKGYRVEHVPPKADDAVTLLRLLREEVRDWQDVLSGEREGLDGLCARIDSYLQPDGKALGWIAELETRHFHFEAHGLTEEEANEAMGRLLDAHARQCGLRSDRWQNLYEGSFTTRHFMPGTGFRDGESLI